jgi:hypothetical protein
MVDKFFEVSRHHKTLQTTQGYTTSSFDFSKNSATASRKEAHFPESRYRSGLAPFFQLHNKQRETHDWASRRLNEAAQNKGHFIQTTLFTSKVKKNSTYQLKQQWCRQKELARSG